jgi:16S rRNA (adenine1518-N6/adenine1519-N6)-dimethyltransferase
VTTDSSYQPADTDGEILPVVDLDDREVGTATRAKIHARDLVHRAVHVVLHDGAGRVLVARRSARKDRFPGWWDVAVGGHVGCGEAYAEAAIREMREEMAIEGAEPRLVAVLPPGDDNGWEHIHVFEAGVDPAQPRPNPDEIDAARWVTRAEFLECFEPASDDPSARMTPASHESFLRYFRGGG